MLDPDFHLRKVVLCPDFLWKWLSRIKLPKVANMHFRRPANSEPRTSWERLHMSRSVVFLKTSPTQ